MKKDGQPSKPAKQSNLFAFIGIAVGIISAGLWVKPFITKSLSFGFANNAGIEVRQETFLDRYEHGCPLHQFKSVRLLSRSPHMILIDGFVTPEEAEVLIRVAYTPADCCLN